MSQVLVFGGTGLLGTCLVRMFGYTPISHDDCNILHSASVEKVLDQNPGTDVVINCAGQVKSIGGNWEVNSRGPHVLEKACERHGIHLVHISTNCVFDGQRGLYSEQDSTSPVEAYGCSKIAGELVNHDFLTIRTSFVGYPDPKGRGLLHWFAHNNPVNGFRRVRWNGLTNVVLAEWIRDAIQMQLKGLRHVHGPAMSKYELLRDCNNVYNWGKTIVPVDMPVADYTLCTLHANGCLTIPFIEQLAHMHKITRTWE